MTSVLGCRSSSPRDVDSAPVLAALATLPPSYRGLPVFFTSESSFNGWDNGAPAMTTAAALFRSRLGFDPAAGITLADWLTTPTQLLATVTAGPVFSDPENLLTDRRAAVQWYPDDVWKYALAAGLAAGRPGAAVRGTHRGPW